VRDPEWDEMLAKYTERVPVPVFRTDPPIKSRIDEQCKQEECESDDSEDSDGE
jgi:hypothetical protein